MIELNERGIRVDGQYRVLLCASIFYFRLPAALWEDRIDMLLAAGYNTADVYFPWNFHETAPGKWDFTGDKDAEAFLKLCCEKGLMVIARPGPYICSEWDGGSMPAWIAAGGGVVRDNDPDFLAAVKKWYDRILPVIKKYEYPFAAGGVVLVQIENELDFFDCRDAAGYIAALKRMADAAGISVPVFACAGQMCAPRAGGTVDGVYPTYNFYPDSRDNTFDAVMRAYAERLGKLHLPLLVSETNRDHFLLRRELAAGAKLLGAYNQVAGSHFGFTEAVNNWGKPLAFLSTMYDFGSMVTALGEFSAEAEKAAVFAAAINAYGEALASAVPYTGEISVKSDFPTAVNALDSGAGLLVCVPNFSDKAGKAEIEIDGQRIKVEVEPWDAPFVPVGLRVGATTVTAECEMIGVSGNRLTFRGKGAVHTSGARAEIGFCTVTGPGKRPADKRHETVEAKSLNIAPGDVQGDTVAIGEKAGFEQNGLYRGQGVYRTRRSENKIFIEDPADIVSAYKGDVLAGATTATGAPEIFASDAPGDWTVRVEGWGHSNFDDARRKSLRLTAGKGAAGLYGIASETEIKYFKFTLLDEFGGDTISVDGGQLPTVLTLSKWNSTRVPVVCAYSFPAARTADKLYLRLTGDIESLVYVDGKKIGAGTYGWVDLTAATCAEEKEITIVIRKYDWSADCGKAILYSLNRWNCTLEKRDETVFDRMQAPAGKTTAFPVRLEKGKTYLATAEVPYDVDCLASLSMTAAKATIATGGRTVARITGKWAGFPQITGGSETDFFVPAAWCDGKLVLYIEALDDGASIDRLAFVKRND